VIFILPIRTTNPLNNAQGFSKGATFAKARQRKQQRSIAEMATRVRVQGRMSMPIVVTITRLAPSSGLDSDGLAAAMKSVRDGIADGLGLANDRDPRVRWVLDQRRTPRSLWGVEIRIEPEAEVAA